MNLEDYDNRKIFSIEEYDNKKFLHFWGEFRERYDGSWTELQYRGWYILLRNFFERYHSKVEEAYKGGGSRQRFVDYASEEDAVAAIDKQLGNHDLKPLNWSELSMDTPVGNYIEVIKD